MPTFSSPHLGANFPTIVALHGFTGGGDDFAPLVEVFPEFSWITPDLPGHAPDLGAPRAPGDDCSLEASLRYLDSIIPARSSKPTVLLGYSLGGRLALRYALAHPERIDALALIGTSPGIENTTKRMERKAEDDRLAEHILTSGIPAFLEEWQRRPLIATQASLPEAWRTAMQTRRQRLRAEGLAASLRQFGQGVLEPVWSRLGTLAMPTFICVGLKDQQYISIAQNMHARCPYAELSLLFKASHLAHLENRDEFAPALHRFVKNIR